MENFIVNQINPNFNKFYERKQAQPQFRSNFATPQEEQILSQNTELPEIYKIDIDAQEKEKQTLVEKVKKLAEDNKWKVYVRYFSDYEAEYRYDTIKKIKLGTKKTNN